MATKKIVESNGATATLEIPTMTAPRLDIVGITTAHGSDSLLKVYNDSKAIRGRVVARGQSVEKTGRANIKDGSVTGRTSFKSYCKTNEEIRAFDICAAVEGYCASCVAIETLTRYNMRHDDAPVVNVAAYKARQFKAEGS